LGDDDRNDSIEDILPWDVSEAEAIERVRQAFAKKRSSGDKERATVLDASAEVFHQSKAISHKDASAKAETVQVAESNDLQAMALRAATSSSRRRVATSSSSRRTAASSSRRRTAASSSRRRTAASSRKMTKNLAYKRPASMSSQRKWFSASRAVDGNTKSNDRKYAHTKKENNPWLQITLDEVAQVDTLRVVNRGDCCGGRLEGFEILIDGRSCAKGLVVPQGLTGDFRCGLKGQKVKILLPGKKRVLNLMEVEVYGPSTNSPISIVYSNPQGCYKKTGNHIKIWRHAFCATAQVHPSAPNVLKIMHWYRGGAREQKGLAMHIVAV